MRWTSVAVLCAFGCRGNAPPTSTTQSGSAPPTAPSAASIPRDVFWHDNGALMVDVDGNGVTDLVGRATDAYYGKRYSIVAIDGATGRLLWRTRIPDPHPIPVVALWNGVVVSMQAGDQLVGIDVKTGARRWSMPLPQYADWFCSRGSSLFAMTVGKTVEIDVATGSTGAEIDDRELRTCTSVIHDRENGDPSSVPWGVDQPFVPSAIYPNQHWRIAGSEQTLRVAAVSTETYVERASHPSSETSTIWKTPLAIPEGFTASQSVKAALGPDTACVAIVHEGPAYRTKLTCLDLATGARRWDLDVKSLDSLYIANERLYLVGTHRIGVHEVRTGTPLWELGCEADKTITGCATPDPSP